MKIKTIKLITDWTIYIWEMEDDLTDINTTGICGQCFNRKNTIHIYPGMSKAETKKNTFTRVNSCDDLGGWLSIRRK